MLDPRYVQVPKYSKHSVAYHLALDGQATVVYGPRSGALLVGIRGSDSALS